MKTRLFSLLSTFGNCGYLADRATIKNPMSNCERARDLADRAITKICGANLGGRGIPCRQAKLPAQ